MMNIENMNKFVILSKSAVKKKNGNENGVMRNEWNAAVVTYKYFHG